MYGVYTCGRCGGSVTRSTRKCPHCGVLLSGIRCRGCGFVGGEGDFPNHRCPKCGKAVSIGSSGSPRAGSASSSSQGKLEPCKGCGKKIPENEWTCPHCGYTQWGMIRGMALFGLFCLIGAGASLHWIEGGFWRVVLGWGGLILGLFVLAGTSYEAVKGKQARKKFGK